MQSENTRNTVIFIILSMVILIGYQIFVLGPQAEKAKAARAKDAAAAAQMQGAVPGAAQVPGLIVPGKPVSRDVAAGLNPRVPVETPSFKGSVSLTGARIDDLYLNNYRESLKKDAPAVELFRPEGAEHAYFAQLGWVGQNVPDLPGANTRWLRASGDILKPGAPLVLTYDNGKGLSFTREISVDDKYLFTIKDTVTNRSAGAITLAPYGSVQRQGVPKDLGKNMILHEGAIGVFDGKLEMAKYDDWKKKRLIEQTSTGGWMGITDKYWLAALIPNQNAKLTGTFRVTDAANLSVNEAGFIGAARTIAPGMSHSETTHLFAGAKRAEVLEAYGKQLNTPRLDSAIDWGNFWFFTRPLFWLLEQFFKFTGNFGVAIILLTVVTKLVFFPLANKSYESMSKIKKLQPQVDALKARFKDDVAKQQQEMMALYQREKVSPLSGCLPMLVQIPVFYALYKVLFVTIELRHAPFFGWIRDLADRDPTSFINLFGLIPWDPATTPMIGAFLNGPLHIGILPLVYGLSMWLQTAMNPPAQDPVQRQIFGLMPILFTFIMAPFASGLLIYWIWNNILTIAQQYVIMRRLQVENPIDELIAKIKDMTAKGTV
ncbi:MAG: membrane protein insertase YidC [Asticcacaulis sp.]